MRRLVMAGVGPAQLLLLEGLAAGKVKASDPLLISTAPTWAFDAMLPGWLAGRHDETAMSLDLRRVAERAGCRYVDAGITRIDAANRRIELDDGRKETWEALSLSRNSIPCDSPVPGATEFAFPIHPMARARDILPAIKRAQQDLEQREIRIAVIGAGGRGFEVACALRARLDREDRSATIMLVDGEAHLLPDCHPAARALAARVLRRFSIGSALGARVTDLSRRGLRLGSGATIPADVIIWTIGTAPLPVLADSGLALDERGFVQVDGTLRSVSHPDVFVAGESIDKGPVLTDNVTAFCGGGAAPKFRRYRPASRPLVLLDCSDGSALLACGSIAREGRLAMLLKERLDRRFMSRVQPLAGAT